MLTATLVLLSLGLLASLMLAIASKVFYVWEDPRIEQVSDALLGANCGGCGFAGCASAAEAVVFGKSNPDVCVAGGFEIAQNVAGVMGVVVEEKEPEISRPGCSYGTTEADTIYEYNGLSDCRAGVLLYGGQKECEIGCLGLGTCVKACPFDALYMSENNLPVVYEEKCRSCGKCAEVCPKDIITLSSSFTRILEENKITECTAPCERNCPAEIDIPEYIKRVTNKDYAGAINVIKEKNPFPLICGWLCPAPCEHECRRNLIDEPVAINAVKKYVANVEMEKGEYVKPYLPKVTGKKVTVVGGGVEGLTAAYFLRRLGHQPSIYEGTEQFGGILRYVISDDRLPKKVLDWEIKNIEKIGIKMETSKRLGKDYSIFSLLNTTSDFVLLTTGGWDSRQIMRNSLDEEAFLPNTSLLIDFLHKSSNELDQCSFGKRAAIIGGGKIAQKAAQILLDIGVDEINIIYPFSQSDTIRNGIDIPQNKKINIIYSAVPDQLSGDEKTLKSLTIKHQHGEIEKIDLDYLIVDSARFPEMLFKKSETNGWQTVKINNIFKNQIDGGIFYGNQDSRTSDLERVISAVGNGRKLARAIHLLAMNQPLTKEKSVILSENELQNITVIDEPEKFKIPGGHIDPIQNLSEEETLEQAERCLQCGLICYKDKIQEN